MSGESAPAAWRKGRARHAAILADARAGAPYARIAPTYGVEHTYVGAAVACSR